MAPDMHAPEGINPDVPSPARTYDYLLGGKDHYLSDRRMAEAFMADFPQAQALARANRAFVRRAVRYLAEEAGIRQFLDIGSGLPTVENVHQVAQRHAPGSRVLYADNDPSVLAHGRALLADDDSTIYAQADVRDVDVVLGAARRFLNLAEPAAVLCTAVLHYVPDGDDPVSVMRHYARALAPGSYVVLSHMTLDGADLAVVQRAVDSWKGRQFPRPRAEIEAMLQGLEMVEPGLVDVELWRPEDGTEPGPLRVIGAVARRP